MLRESRRPNVAIVSSYNDMLSAHQPFERFPEIIKRAAREAGATAQFAGGVPAMCDGVTQGEPGMELSLFSRDVIALATAVALSHNMFDAVLCLGVCDKIVPGLLIGALQFSHLPVIFVPGGPMPSGLSNDEKARVRQRFAKGEVGRDALLDSEARSYHSPGTCTFYGTANSNQMLMEVMGLHLPGAAFVNPNTPLRDALTVAAATRAVAISALGAEYTPIGRVVDERAVVNGIVGLLATGGSTNHTIHLVAIARAAGIFINWDDFRDLSDVVPLVARVYPNGKADVNQFHAAGGMGYVIGELLDAKLLHGDVTTVAGEGGLHRYREEPALHDGTLAWHAAPSESRDASVLAPASAPFSADGGLKLLVGNLGRAIIKTSAVKAEHRVVRAPAIVFDNQEAVMAAFDRGELQRDFVAVVRYQGPRANGMPELHKLTPLLGVLQDQGFHVALVTDGRMSGASGKVPAAIHVTPECLAGGRAGARAQRRHDCSRWREGRAASPGRRCPVAGPPARGRRLERLPPWHGARVVRGVSRQRARCRAGRGDVQRVGAARDARRRRRASGPRPLRLHAGKRCMNTLELMRIGPVIPVIVIDHLEHAVPLARALVAGGVRVLEVTLRTPVALQAIRAIASEVDGAILGVGTITRAQDFARSIEAGAVFGVSPGLTPELVAGARDSGAAVAARRDDAIGCHRCTRRRIHRDEAVSRAAGRWHRHAQGAGRTVSRRHVLSHRGRLGCDGARLSGAAQCRLRRRIVVDAARRRGRRRLGTHHDPGARSGALASTCVLTQGRSDTDQPTAQQRTPSRMPQVSSFDLLLFGGTGDLAMRKLLPALYYRHRDGDLPAHGRIIASARESLTRGDFIAQVEASFARFVPEAQMHRADFDAFVQRLDYIKADANAAQDFAALARALKDSPADVRVFFCPRHRNSSRRSARTWQPPG